MSDNLLMILQAVAMNDLEEARYYGRALCHESPSFLPDDFAIWLEDRLYCDPEPEESPMEEISDDIPDDIQSFVVVEDLSKSFNPNRYWVSEHERNILEDIISLRKSSQLLANANIPFLNATLLYGQSGTGKTQFGRYLAYALDLPFVYVNLCNLVGSQLGETGRNLQKIFRFVQSTPCVFMLDELDAIGANRGTYSTGGSGDEMTRTTIALMQCLDLVRRDVVLLAATNRADMLDQAVRRRFTARHEMTTFTPDESFLMVLSYLQDVRNSSNLHFTWDEDDIRSQCTIGRTQSDLISLCNRAIVRAISTDNIISLHKEEERSRNSSWI